jgi:signal peptidase I
MLPACLIPLASATGILRRHVWGAWGFALYLLVGGLMLPMLLLRSGGGKAIATVVGGSFFSLCLAWLFYLAGRALATDGANPGRWAPWAWLSALAALPFFFFQAFVVPTGSMEDTLLVGDRIIVRWNPGPQPRRDEVMALVYPMDREQTFIKRIAGMPGDRIRLRHKVLYRNGAIANEPWVRHKLDHEDLYRDNFPAEPNTMLYPPAVEMLEKNVMNGELVVPPGKYFVLGDNRDQSLDSRYWGFVSEGDFIGRPVMIYDSEEVSMDLALTHNDLFHRGHTRWNRLFKLL